MQNLDEIYHQTIQIYDRHAHAYDQHRSRKFFEKKWLDKFIASLPPQGRVLDVGCGAGEPIAKYLLQCGFQLTGVDASSKMLEISRSRFPTATWIKMDMRELNLETKFDGIIAWDSFFHLKPQEQREVLILFAKHLSSQGSLLLTVGNEFGETTGYVEGEPVYHSSLSPEEYKTILKTIGFKKIEIVLEDESCDFHSLLLARKEGD
ncbi:MAG: class I SAM-dependent methyltransferase [Calditrichaeota bacterium]|nr:MAG: class I SAM-dependent methyltransferase [Calditrichota bacterium]